LTDERLECYALFNKGGDINMAESVGADQKMKGALAYLLGPVTGILLLLTEKKSEYIRFHSMQSTLLGVAIFLFYIVLAIVPILGPVVAVILTPGVSLVVFILWILLMWKAYTGERYKLPYIGNIAEKQLEKFK